MKRKNETDWEVYDTMVRLTLFNVIIALVVALVVIPSFVFFLVWLTE